MEIRSEAISSDLDPDPVPDVQERYGRRCRN